ncbi:unnamed protein product [Urochloa humidicola]
MDPKSGYLLKIRHLDNPKYARKDPTAYYMDDVVDSDTTNFKDFVESIVTKFPPRYMEVAHVQYYDDVSKSFPEVKTDQEFMAMFDKYIQTKIVNMFIINSHPSQPFQPITEWQHDDLSQPMMQPMQNEKEYLQNPFPENEIVGVDEEVMYLPNELVNVVTMGMHDQKEKNYEDEDKDEDEDDEGSDCEVEDDE